MKYVSTREGNTGITASQAIIRGIAPDGGLYVPERIPAVSLDFIRELCGANYRERAVKVLGLYLEEFTQKELEDIAAASYGDNFDDAAIAPLRVLDDGTAYLELWHGPTSAFKDLALQMLPRLLSASMKRTGEEKTACILVATSGDTGKAAMEGFANVERVKILTFYPENGVSQIQKLQMVTQEGGNVGVCAVKGNFDDAQSGVKRIFSDPAIREELARRGYFLSSANSINWGRILPQVVYYVSAYCDLLNAKAIRLGEPVNFCVPTGNFGNILACYYAKRMGLPVNKLICASNRNDVLTDFIRTGVYDKNRPFHTTMSPSMDILVSSNLERLLFDMSGGKDELVRDYMAQLAEKGRYEITPGMKGRMQEVFWGGFCDEEATSAAIAEMYKEKGYLIDPHTAVAAKVLADYRRETGDGTTSVFVSTASPYKFCDSVLTAIGETPVEDSVDRIAQMEAVTGAAAPARLAALKGKTPRFDQTVERDRMEDVVLEFLK